MSSSNPPDPDPSALPLNDPPPRAISVLLVEDDEIDAAIIREVLRSTDYLIIWERDHDAAHERLMTERIDLVISDLLLPSGVPDRTFEVLRQLSMALPVIIVSGWTDKPPSHLFSADLDIKFFNKNNFDPDAFRAVVATLALRGHAPPPTNPFSRRRTIAQAAARLAIY